MWTLLNAETNVIGLILLELATFYKLVLTNTRAPHTVRKVDMAQLRQEASQPD